MLPPMNDLAPKYPQFTLLGLTNLGILFSPAHPARSTPSASKRMVDRCTTMIRLSIVGIQVRSDLGFSLYCRVIES